MRRVAVIGPGRVGGALAIALQRGGDSIVAVAGSSGVATGTSASLARFAEIAPAAEVRPVAAVADGVDLVVCTTPDDAIEPTARAVAAADGVAEGQRWVHTAGGRGVEVLSSVVAAGGRAAACHPAMTFPDPITGAERLRGASWAVTADAADLGWARVLVTDLGGSPITLPATSRTLYHAGLAVGSNATSAVVALARDMLLGAGIDDPAGFLTPLATASAEGAAARGVDALTGPVSRGDSGTVAAHLQELRATFPEAVDAYVVLSELILAQSVRRGLAPERADAIRRALRGT